jgi:hypothetical protein
MPPASPAEIASSILDFSDAEFMAAPNLDVHAREVRLLDADFTGVAINAQRRIEVDAQSALPIAIAARYGGERDWDLPLMANCLLVAMDTLGGQVAVEPGLVPPKVLASRAGASHDRGGAPRPAAEELEGAGAQVSWTEVRERIGVPWRTGLWSFGLIYFDWLSNVVSVELAGGPPAPPSAGAPPFVSPEPAAPAPGLPTFQRRSRTPPPPARGVSFEVELEAVDTTKKLYVDGAFATPARTYSLVAGMVVPDGGQSFPVAAIVPLTLLLVGANSVYPWRRDLAVPVYREPVQQDQMVQGCFALDVLAGGSAPSPGAYACYLVLDGAIYGPKPVHMT